MHNQIFKNSKFNCINSMWKNPSVFFLFFWKIKSKWQQILSSSKNYGFSFEVLKEFFIHFLNKYINDDIKNFDEYS